MSTGGFHTIIYTENNEIMIAGNDSNFEDDSKKIFTKVSFPL